MAPNLNVSLGPLKLKNPVVVASGTFGYGEEFAPFYDLGALGAITVKGLTLRPRQGNAPHRLAETPCGMLNSIGLQNVGVESFIREKLPFLREVHATLIANITGETMEEYGELASRLDGVEGIHAIEINLSCPNVKKGGIQFGTDPEGVRTVVRTVREKTGLPVLAKISPNVTDVVILARAAKEGGADGLAMINTLLGMAVDLKKRKPVLSNIFGGLSGPAIKPVALRMIWQVFQKVDIPILGMGGIMTAKDALEFMLVGSTAVAVGTANLVKPRAAWDCLRGLQEYFEQEGIPGADDFIGTLSLGPTEDPTMKETTP